MLTYGTYFILRLNQQHVLPKKASRLTILTLCKHFSGFIYGTLRRNLNNKNYPWDYFHECT